MAQYLIGYDISDPKRLQRIYRKMTHYCDVQFNTAFFY